MGNFKYNRFSIRLTKYDYSQPGYYFITLVTQNRDKKFGVIFNKKMQLNNAGHMIAREWNQIPERFENAVLDKYIIMPDHFHGIIQIVYNNNPPAGENTGNTTLLDIIGAFKSITTNMYINGVNYYKWPRFDKRLWQLRFHDRIIRTENELNGIRKYIIANPVNYYSHTK